MIVKGSLHDLRRKYRAGVFPIEENIETLGQLCSSKEKFALIQDMETFKNKYVEGTKTFIIDAFCYIRKLEESVVLQMEMIRKLKARENLLKQQANRDTDTVTTTSLMMEGTKIAPTKTTTSENFDTK